METNLILEGFKFMALGMATVFTFLGVLILMINLMSIFLHKFFPEPNAGNTPKTQTNTQKNNKKIIAAITSAVTHHKQV